MDPREKRTSTRPGLGQQKATGTQELALPRRPESDAPPTSRPMSGAGRADRDSAPPSARYTRPLESVPVGPGAPGARPAILSEPPRSEPAPFARASDTRVVSRAGRVDASDPYCPPTQRVDMRTGALQPRVITEDVRRGDQRSEPCEPRDAPPSSAPKGGRTETTPSPPASQQPRAAAGSTPAPASAGPRSARSARPSLRVDDVGAAVKSGADAMGTTSRQVPRVIRSKAEIAAAPIDHRAGFLLAHIDGTTTVQGLVDIAGMPEEDVHEILGRLRRLGIVAIR